MGEREGGREWICQAVRGLRRKVKQAKRKGKKIPGRGSSKCKGGSRTAVGLEQNEWEETGAGGREAVGCQALGGPGNSTWVRVYFI